MCRECSFFAGPSGAGKSSLLNILAGRTRASGKVQIEGNITANGVQVDPVQFRKRIACVAWWSWLCG